MNHFFKVAYIKKMLSYVSAEQMTFSRMVEILNEEEQYLIDEICKKQRENCYKHFYTNKDCDGILVAEQPKIEDL